MIKNYEDETHELKYELKHYEDRSNQMDDKLRAMHIQRIEIRVAMINFTIEMNEIYRRNNV